MDNDDVYEPVAYTLAAVLGVVIIVIIILMWIAYYRMRAPLYPVEIEPEKPPDETLGYPYPGYQPPPPVETEKPEVILIPPVIAPLPPADYAMDTQGDAAAGPAPPPDAFVIPTGQQVPPPPPPPPDLKIIKLKRRKKRRDSSSSSSSSDSDSSVECYPPPMYPSMMMLVKPQPVGMSVFSSAPQLPVRAVEDQTRGAVVGAIQQPCAGTPCF